MLEWVVLAVIGGAALLSGGKKSSGNANRPSPRAPQIDAGKLREAEWRACWEPKIDKSRWIPSGTAARILAEFPPPSSASWLDAILNKNPALAALEAEFKTHNWAFSERQKARLKAFFDTVEKEPLTDEQIHACICMDDNVQIVAAAGSGKTSTMVAKTGYVLKEGLAAPEQILLLAFNTDAAKELGTRIQKRLADVADIEKVTAKTFHSFGLQVIGAATGKKPTLAPWLENPGDDIKMIVEIIDALAAKDATFGHDWNLYRTVFARDVGRWGEKAVPDAYGEGRRGFRTANGEIVKSKEERLIADWLFYHGVAYEYERSYEHDTADQSHRQYRPDFYYPEIGLYHEHFALNDRGEVPDDFGSGYLEGIAWKRQLHADQGTKLFETTSGEISAGKALGRLREALESQGVEIRFDPTREAPGARPVSNAELASTLRVFQQHVKSNGLSREQLQAALTQHSERGHKERLTLFVSLYHRISDEWERRLRDGNCIDFEDMSLLAAEHIEAGRFQSSYTVVLADEFQDSSRARIRLLKALTQGQNGQAHLCVVGDDWQGINRFAGADISVMMEFERTFPNATRLTLNTTFRCPQALCDASSTFVQANPVQIRKEVRSTNCYAKRALMAFGFMEMNQASAHLEAQLEQMHALVGGGRLQPARGNQVTVLLLGRYRNDRPALLGEWRRRFGDHLAIDFRTVHSSKGLQAEYVMILNVTEGTRGFPSQIEDDPVLQIPMPAPDPFPMAEERRLFYVALTRAIRQVRIYTSLSNPSQFLIELVKSGSLEIEAIGAEALEACPQCEVGVLQTKNGKYGPFQGCSTHPKCDFTREIPGQDGAEKASPVRLEGFVPQGSVCPTCLVGVMQVNDGRYGRFLGCSGFPECRTTAKLH